MRREKSNGLKHSLVLLTATTLIVSTFSCVKDREFNVEKESHAVEANPYRISVKDALSNLDKALESIDGPSTKGGDRTISKIESYEV